MSRTRRLILALIVLSATLPVAAGLWLRFRDPLSALTRAEAPPVATGFSNEARGDRTLQHIVLEAPPLGRIGLAVSLPDPLPARKLPLVLVLGGLGTGEHNIRYITEAGDNAIIGYDWPMPTRLPQGIALVSEAPDLYRRIMIIPGQVSAALRWLSVQPWADRERISLLGFSLGALAAPAVQRVAARDGLSIGWTVLAYGGAPIGDLLATHPYLRPAWLGPLLGAAADLLFRPIDPTSHLPYLSGRFLVLAGTNDTFIPDAAAARLRDLTPEPKQTITFAGGHMGVGPQQLALLAEIIRASRTWLVESGAANPPAEPGNR